MAWKNYKKFTKEEKAKSDELVRRGHVRHLLTPKQRDLLDLIEKTPRIKASYYASRRCLPEGTMVQTPTGPRPIESLQIGDFVLGVADDGSVAPAKVLEWYDQGEQDVYPLYSRGRLVAEATKNHRFLCRQDRDLAHCTFYKGKREVERRATYYRDLTVEDLSKQVSGWKIVRDLAEIPIHGKTVKDAYALGALLGDGCSRQGTSVYHVSSDGPEIPNKIAEVIGVNTVHRQCEKNYTWLIGQHDGKVYGNRRVFKVPVITKYEEWCKGKFAHEKTIETDELEGWDRESLKGLLAGLLDTDGSCGVRKTGKQGGKILHISFVSGSRKLVEGVRYLIDRLYGYEANILKEKHKTYVNSEYMYLLSINNTLHAKRILKDLKEIMVCPRKKWNPEWEAVEAYNSHPEYIGVKVGSTPRKARTYDIHISCASNRYLLSREGLVTHNSGKTWGSVLMAYGLCIKYPKLTLRFILDSQVQARDVIWPIARDMQDVIPQDCLPVIKKADMEIHFKNGSIIKLGSSNKEHCDKLRGTKCDIVICDEASFHDAGNWEHVIYSLLMPQMLHSDFGQFIFTTTPPVDVQHPFILHELVECRMKGHLVTSDIYENVFLTPALIAEVIDGYRAKEKDPNFRREHLLELLPADDLRVTPEFDKETHVYGGDPYKFLKCEGGHRTDFCSYISFDYGVTDNTAILLGILDWRSAELRIVKENIMRGRDENYLSNFASAIRETQVEARMYSQESLLSGDCFEAIRNSLAKDHGIVALTTNKGTLEGTIGVLRNALSENKILIHESCTQLISDLSYSLWKESDSDTKKIARSNNCAHSDGLMALAYLLRRISWTRRPNGNKSLDLGARRR